MLRLGKLSEYRLAMELEQEREEEKEGRPIGGR